jgi:membrane-bound lytic murein transglycosylase D
MKSLFCCRAFRGPLLDAMTLFRLGLALGAACVLSACTTLTTVPLAASGRDAHAVANASPETALPSPNPDTYTLSAPPRKRSPSLVPNGPLSLLTVAPEPQPVITSVAPLAAPADLWERMRRGFAMPDLDTDLVRDREAWYSARPDYLERMTERGSKYLFHIVEELERRNLPLELALLPFIESAFNPQAVSHAKAAGMWQFMPATGRHFDLKQNTFRDDRRDVLASTRAALDYLERLYGMFGDWHLALAAYNWGEGSVGRAIKRNQAAGLPTGYTDLRMPTETRYYVPKFQAMKNIIAAPQRFQTRLPAIGNHPFFDAVPIDRDMDVALIARLADVSEKDLRQLNPSHNKPVILAAGTPQVLLPWDNAKRFEERLQQHQGPLASWTAWRVPQAMTAAQVAQQHGMNEQTLREVNRIPPRMQLRAGSTVLVPRQERQVNDVPVSIADNGQILLAPERGAARKVKVRKGETLAKIARAQKVSVAALREWNQLKPNATLRAGQVLVLYGGKAPTQTVKKPAKAAKGTQLAASKLKP